MGRHEKQIGSRLGVDRRESGYYATPEFVAHFIAQVLLELNPRGTAALDPCVGRGEMAGPLLSRGVRVRGLDVLPFDVPAGVDFRCEDFLDFYRAGRAGLPAGRGLDLPFDFYVANPPYNCHESSYIRARKPQLQRLFGPVGAHNMYSMFLSALIDCAKPGALIGVITLDSFLTARAHAGLRDQILRTCAVHYLLLGPTDLFRDQGADVRTCVIVLQKGRAYQRKVKVANRPTDTREFQRLLQQRSFRELPLASLVLSGPDDRAEFVVGVPDDVRGLFASDRLGAVYRCITGISTGNDGRYLSRRARPGFTRPFFKNPGTRKFYAPPNAYLADDFLEQEKRVPNFAVRNKDLLFAPGITCSSMGVPFSACYLPPGATCGVNANIILPDAETWWLMAYLNSHLVTYLVRGVLIRSNMITSGYVARIPVPRFRARARAGLSDIARRAYQARVAQGAVETCVAEVNRIVEAETGLAPQTVQVLRTFAENLIRAT